MRELTIAEQEHANRAKALDMAFGTVEALAEFLHQNYRAFAKSPHATGRSAAVPGITGCNHATAHDHGFERCSARMYFFRRATWLMTEQPFPNGRPGKESA